MFVAQAYKQDALKFLLDSILTLAGALACVANGVARIACSMLFEKFGFKKVYAGILIIQIIDSLLIYHCRPNQYIYPICVIFAFACQGSHIVLFPAVAVRTFGMRSGGFLSAIILTGAPFGALATSLIV